MPIHERDRLALSKAWTEQIAQFLAKMRLAGSGYLSTTCCRSTGKRKKCKDIENKKTDSEPTTETVLIDAAGFVVPKYAKVNKADTKAPAVANFEISGTEAHCWTIKLELGTSSNAKQPVEGSNGVKLTASIVSAKGKPPQRTDLFCSSGSSQAKYNGGAEVLGVQGGWSTPTDKNEQVLTSVWLLDQPV